MKDCDEPVTYEHVDNHPGNRLMLMILAYSSTKDILSMNCFEVLRFIQEIERGRFSDIALNHARRLEYRDFENHLIRYFHNFLAGAKTLVDHTRNMMRSDSIADAHRTAYQAQVDATFSDDLSKFIGDLRNYTLHCGLPSLAHTCSLPGENWEVVLTFRELRQWDGWTARSRRFMDTQPESIRLSWLIASYQQTAMSFHQWLINSFSTHYGSIFAEFDSLTARYSKQHRV